MGRTLRLRTMIRLSARVYFFMGTFLALCVVLPLVEAQGLVHQLNITDIDASNFPLIEVLVTASDDSGRPVELTSDSNLRLYEDTVELPITSVGPQDVGMRLAFVIDVGDGMWHTGVSLSYVFEEAERHLQQFVLGRPWMMAGSDEVALLIQEGPTTNVLAAMETTPEVLGEVLQNYLPPSDVAFKRAPTQGQYTRAALEEALDELIYTPGAENKRQAIVLFSPGVKADLSEVVERAKSSDVPIHVVLTRSVATTYWDRWLTQVASATGGEFITLFQSTDLEPFFDRLTSSRRQQVISYRSASSSQNVRQVILELVQGEETLRAANQYSIELEPAQVRITYPSDNTVVTREGQEGSDSPSDANPTFLVIKAQVSWPDGYSRRIRPVQLLVDNQLVGETQLVEGEARLTWDIREYQEEGQVPAMLQVQVEDELGLLGVSPQVTVAIEYIAPAGFALKPSESVLVYVSLGIALAAVALAVYLFINRARVAPALQQAGESIVDFVERVTGRRTALVARAYLVPLEGFDRVPSRPFAVYGTTAIGRSRRHADLLFHINDDDSPISRLHCTILDEDDHLAIRDEDSTNGTLVNDEKLTPLEPIVLHDGDILDVAPLERGGLRFLFQLAREDGVAPDMDEDLRRTRPRRTADQGS